MYYFRGLKYTINTTIVVVAAVFDLTWTREAAVTCTLHRKFVKLAL